MNMFYTGIAYVIMSYLFALQGALAIGNNMATLHQMWNYRRLREGLPFIWHGGMCGDVFIITPLVAAIVGYYGVQWSWMQIGIALVAGFIASYGMHETYKSVPWPEAHAEPGRLTDVGCIHLVYMGLAFAALLLYYIRLASPSELGTMAAVSALLVFHVTIGNHVVLGLLKSNYPTTFAWYPGDPLRSSGTWGAIGATALLTFGRTAWLAYRGY